MNRFYITTVFTLVFWIPNLFAQSISDKNILINSPEYQKLKESGALLPLNFGKYNLGDSLQVINPIVHTSNTNKSNIICDCWIDPDGTYTLAMTPNDDGSSNLINLPFSFCLYGQNFNSVYINNNGNVSFGAPYATFSANAFPDAAFVMVAPFWGDVDTRGIGQVLYKVTPTAMYVNWVDVGYFNNYTDKINNFQLIITNGNDPVLGVGNNVLFCYKDMQWTTGDASGGTNGFGGIAATVGANRGNGVDYIQFGQFDQAGIAYDGPFGNPDGISWLDNQAFLFSTCVTGTNIAPVLNGLSVCDTIIVCEGQSINIDALFLAPENGQTVTVTVDTTGVSGFVITSNTPGASVNFESTFTGTSSNLGVNNITIIATDNGTPPLSSTITAVFVVNYSTANFTSSFETNGFSFVNDEVTFTDNSSAWPSTDSIISWVWDFGDGSPYEYLPDVTHIYTDTGYYYVSLIVEGSNGCTDTLTKMIHIIGPVQPSNIFSPNGDGINDYFEILGLNNYPGITTIKIFNRWGDVLFESDNYQNNWNGKNASGKPVTEGVYYYILTNKEWFRPEDYTDFDSPAKDYATYEDYVIYGYVTIVR